MGVTINLNAGLGQRLVMPRVMFLGEDIENVIGSMHDDMLTGTDDVNVGNSLWGLGGADSLFGREGPDMLYGGAGDDMLSGGDEGDTLEGGPGADELTGGLGADTASYSRVRDGRQRCACMPARHGGDARGRYLGDTVTVDIL